MIIQILIKQLNPLPEKAPIGKQQFNKMGKTTTKLSQVRSRVWSSNGCVQIKFQNQIPTMPLNRIAYMFWMGCHWKSKDVIHDKLIVRTFFFFLTKSGFLTHSG